MEWPDTRQIRLYIPAEHRPRNHTDTKDYYKVKVTRTLRVHTLAVISK